MQNRLSQPTYADIAVMDLLQTLQDPEDPTLRGLDRTESRFLTLQHFPRLAKLAKRVSFIPGIAR